MFNDLLCATRWNYLYKLKLEIEKAKAKHGDKRFNTASEIAKCTGNDVFYWLKMSDDDLVRYHTLYCSETVCPLTVDRCAPL